MKQLKCRAGCVKIVDFLFGGRLFQRSYEQIRICSCQRAVRHAPVALIAIRIRGIALHGFARRTLQAVSTQGSDASQSHRDGADDAFQVASSGAE
jgi:hypothetical protein